MANYLKANEIYTIEDLESRVSMLRDTVDELKVTMDKETTRMKEIRKLYLNGNFYVIAVGTAVCIPLAKVVMDAMYPLMVSNVASGCNIHFGWQIYVGLYVCVIALYFAINHFLVKHLQKIEPAEVLKNRE